jgi:hypothetical protein
MKRLRLSLSEVEQMEKNFTTQQDFLDTVREALPKDDHNAPFRDAIIDGIRNADNALAGWKEQDSAGQELRLGRWFVRNDDFPFFELIGAIASAAAVLAASGGVAASALIAPISSFASVCWQVRRKGAKLAPEQVAVLSVLNTNGGISIEEISDKLTAMGRGIARKQVLSTLSSLAGLELYDGTVVPLVRSDGDKWRALRV